MVITWSIPKACKVRIFWLTVKRRGSSLIPRSHDSGLGVKVTAVECPEITDAWVSVDLMRA